MTDLPVSTPQAEGVDPAGIAALVDALERQPGTDPHGLMVLRHGKQIAAGWWKPYIRERPTLMYSLSKSFTATALGLAVGEGLLELDRPVADYLPELQGVDVSPRMRHATLRHLVSMRSGHRHDTWEPASRADDDAVRGLFRLEPENEPGTIFCYNQPPILTISAAVQAASGQTLTEFLRPRLFAPLGIEQASWKPDRTGRDLGFSGLFVTLDTVARLGELYRGDGVWQGERVLPEGWVELAGAVHADTSGEVPADWQQGYCFGFWRSRHGYRGDGAYGQFCLILTELEMVVAITSSTENMQNVLDAVWLHLLPAVDRAADHGGQDADVQAALSDRLATLELAAAAGTVWRPDLGDVSATFRPFDGEADQQPSLTAVEIDSGRVVLVEGDVRTAVSFEQDPDAVVIAAAGLDGDLVLLDLHFVFSPHRMWISADRRTGTFTAGWATGPLHGGPLAEQWPPDVTARSQP